ncbi:hypothetical protein P7C70_g1613, partial [Phenoliferia sp. Uapishka_3]
MSNPRSPTEGLPIASLYRRPRTPLTPSFGPSTLAPILEFGFPSSTNLHLNLSVPPSPTVRVQLSPPPVSRRKPSSRTKGAAQDGKVWEKGLRWARDLVEMVLVALSVAGMCSNAVLLGTSLKYYSSWMGFNVELLVASIMALLALPTLRLYVQPQHPSLKISSIDAELSLTLVFWALFTGEATLLPE